jgi:hypothetical protein
MQPSWEYPIPQAMQQHGGSPQPPQPQTRDTETPQEPPREAPKGPWDSKKNPIGWGNK